MKALVYLPLALLCGCTTLTATAPTPADNPASAAPVRVKKDRTFHYQCTQGKLKLTVLDNLAAQQRSKNPSINITFRKVSQRLLPSIAERGKRYTNTQWTWSDNGQSATLSDSLGRPLAENCQRVK
ncbi:MliC family protein [Pasteurellaceae bacterium TAE3-ERU1]|uniref:MliC family protein n=1 Tax=Spirabiliibacterium mucosae TaxID=28156 RepID=UPI001AACFDBC|nr:MliC family protein [Spirabiliibacterium mucosae]MBE2899115.1 MliC family protein [Spirabiliibacterium mucosae]MBV7388933.1 MliC family protein [Pasteurellaceae bacterium TAE3-ERU1]